MEFDPTKIDNAEFFLSNDFANEISRLMNQVSMAQSLIDNTLEILEKNNIEIDASTNID